MLLVLFALQTAEAACQWEAKDLDWRWAGDLVLARDGGPTVVTLWEGTFNAVQVRQEGTGVSVRVTEDHATVWGTAVRFAGLHTVKPLDLGQGLSIGPHAAVGIGPAKNGQVTVNPARLGGSRPYKPDALATPTVACDALTLVRPPVPEKAGDQGDQGLVRDRAVVVYSAPNGVRWGEYPIAGTGAVNWQVWVEGNEMVQVVERQDGFAHIVDDRLSWRVEGWVREEDLVAVEAYGTGGLGARGTGSGGERKCLAAGPLYAVDGKGGVWPVGEVAGSSDIILDQADAAAGYTRISMAEISRIRPGPPNAKGWSFAVETGRVTSCPP